MNCRKCGCLILETDERCPMCEAKQHVGRKRKATINKIKSIVEKAKVNWDANSKKRTREDLKKSPAITAIVVLTIISIGYALFISFRDQWGIY